MVMRENQTDGKIGPECFLNRELSWLEFNLRVLEEAENTENPLMERLKFLAIFSSNLDEFFMVRLAGVREQAFGESAPQDYAPDGLSAIEQLKAVAKRTQDLVARQYRCLKESIGPAMAAEGFELLRYDALEGSHREHVDRFFRERVLPILTPMAVDPAHPSPRYHNRGLYLGVMLEHAEGLGPKRLFAVVQVPQVLPRIVVVPSTSPGRTSFVLLEDVVAARLPELFGGFQVRSWTSFRITRDSDLELLEQEWQSEVVQPEGSRMDALRECLESLPAESRRLLKLRYFDGHNCEEVARSMGIGLPAIYKRVSRLHESLRLCIDGKLGRSSPDLKPEAP
jgi:polyphosphate kinase